jgi:hypothetical protein
MKESAYLIGPFIGELEWEFYRFAPYIINLKKLHPECKFIIYTRPSRFDLYGKYADILVPLNLKNDEELIKEYFSIKYFDIVKYNILIKYLFKKYTKRYQIIKHLYPDIEIWRRRIKWQFPRNEMDYDFKPRRKNTEIIGSLFDSTNSVFICPYDSEIRHTVYNYNYEPIMLDWVQDIVKNQNDGLSCSFIGCVIEILKECSFVVGNMSSSVSKLALLLKIPVISINEKMDYDSISLLNPFNIPVINCENIEEGIEIYEDNF